MKTFGTNNLNPTRSVRKCNPSALLHLSAKVLMVNNKDGLISVIGRHSRAIKKIQLHSGLLVLISVHECSGVFYFPQIHD